MAGGILFDMDGTLIESEPIWMAEEARLGELLGIPWTGEDVEESIGGSLDDFAAKFIARGARHDPLELIAMLSDRVTASVVASMPWIPGAQELLAEIARAEIPAAIVTNSMRRTVEPILEHAPAGSLRFAVTFDDVTRSKPDPEPYLAGASGLGIRPEHALVFEDSLNGAAAARAAGMRIWFVETHTTAPDWAHGAVADLSEVSIDLVREQLAELTVGEAS